MFAKDVREALREQLETATSPTLACSENGEKVQNLLMTLRKVSQRVDLLSNFVNIGGWKTKRFHHDFLLEKSSYSDHLEGRLHLWNRQQHVFKIPWGVGWWQAFFLYFSPFCYLCFLRFLPWTCIAPVIRKINKKSYGKRKVRRLFWQEIAYLENHDVTLGRTGPSCDWAGTAKPWFAGDFFSDCSGSRGELQVALLEGWRSGRKLS